MGLLKWIYRKEEKEFRNEYRILGIKISLTNKKKIDEIIKESIRIQDNYNLSPLENAKKAIVFLVPPEQSVTGGIMSIFYYCQFSRELNPDASCFLSTYPGKMTYAANNKFKNNEKIYRFSQLVEHGKNIENLILHLPEYYSKNFYENMNEKELEYIKSIPKLKINILDQNIDIMPEMDEVSRLLDLTSDISHSCGFKRSVTQEICDRYNMPLYGLPSYINLENCTKKDFEYKKNIILYSNDINPMKGKIIDCLKRELKNFEIIEIQGLAYQEFLDLISESLFCISFGEGFDGYYIQPYYAKSIGITVYNDTFFLNKEIRNLPFVYESYEEMYEKVVDDIKDTYKNKERFEAISETTYTYLKNKINLKNETLTGLTNFYNDRPDFIPERHQ